MKHNVVKPWYFFAAVTSAAWLLTGCAGGNVAPVSPSGLPATQGIAAAAGAAATHKVAPAKDQTTLIKVLLNGRPLHGVDVLLAWKPCDNPDELKCVKMGPTGPEGKRRFYYPGGKTVCVGVRYPKDCGNKGGCKIECIYPFPSEHTFRFV